ncbi:hypothetical protein VP1G_10309 [Cytospora mali]|uniref:Uncharacterized protein n=1 Tax=Cytospora mali TaxID=578113 RepID=A0A194VGP5_CYTMA|nr:hypothetical protein VP1G_10309 [Valsa mali var. pyri (nom. inval.)]
MPNPKTHHRSYTINFKLRTPTPDAPHASLPVPPPYPSQQRSTIQKSHQSHKPSKSTPNAMMSQATQAFPNLPGGGCAVTDSLPRHNRELTLRRYMLLQDEHEFIRRHLDELSATSSASGATGATTSPAPSPTRPAGHGPLPGHTRSDSAARRASMPQYDAPRPRFHRRGGGVGGARAAVRAETMVDSATLAELASEEAKLATVNEGIKRALTELLNCEAARSDKAFRSFCMTRLMETEQELRSGRRRRSCPVD